MFVHKALNSARFHGPLPREQRVELFVSDDAWVDHKPTTISSGQDTIVESCCAQKQLLEHVECVFLSGGAQLSRPSRRTPVVWRLIGTQINCLPSVRLSIINQGQVGGFLKII